MGSVAELHKSVVANIKQEMFRHQLEVPDVAAALGMSASGVYKLLAGTVEVGLDELEKLARLFRTSPGNLLGRPAARDAPTLSEALRTIEREVERVQKQPDLSSVPEDILRWLSTAGPSDLQRVRIAMEGSALGKESALGNKRVKRKDAASE